MLEKIKRFINPSYDVTYLSKVKVVSGFYQGIQGTVISETLYCFVIKIPEQINHLHVEKRHVRLYS